MRMGPQFEIKSLFTAHKRSVGQGNIFTPVYHSVHRGGVSGSRGSGLGGCLLLGGCLVWGAVPALGVPAPGGCRVETPQTATAVGGTHPTGIHSHLQIYLKFSFK